MSCLGRCDVAPAVAVNDRPAPVAATDELVAAARAGRLDPGTVTRHGPDGRGGPWPNDPYAPGEQRYRVAAVAAGRDAERRAGRRRPARIRAARDGRRRLPDRQQVGARRGAAGHPDATSSATPTSPSRAPSRTVRSWPSSRTSCSRGCCSAWSSSARRRAGCSSGTSTAPRRRWSGPRSSALRAEGLLGDDVLGSGRHLSVEVFTSPGGYILGEESALIECMEGHRGEPRNKPPFPGALRPLGQAHADELGRDPRRRARHRRARRGVVARPGRRRAPPA